MYTWIHKKFLLHHYNLWLGRLKSLFLNYNTALNIKKFTYTFQMLFLLSEHLLYKESIVIVKKFDSEILMYLYVLRSPEFIYAIFGVMYVCMCVCMYVRVYVCE